MRIKALVGSIGKRQDLDTWTGLSGELLLFLWWPPGSNDSIYVSGFGIYELASVASCTK